MQVRQGRQLHRRSAARELPEMDLDPSLDGIAERAPLMFARERQHAMMWIMAATFLIAGTGILIA